MLKVTLDIVPLYKITLDNMVPFEDTDKTRHIGTLSISRQRVLGNPCDYDVRLDTDGRTVRWASVQDHYYEDGAWRLVRRALEALEEV